MAAGFFSKLKNIAKKVVQSAPKVLDTASKVVGIANPAAGAALGAAATGSSILANMTRKGGFNSSNINSLLSSGKTLYSSLKNKNQSS